MEDDCQAIVQYSTLLGVLLSGPDGESALDGAHRLMADIRERAINLRQRHDAATQIVYRLAKP